MGYVWPIALVVVSNILYQLCAKGVPKYMDTMASMTVTYTVGALCSAIIYFVINKNGNLLGEYAKMNFAPALLGVSVVGLEVGFIYAYKARWPVSTASIVQRAFLAVALILVGGLVYKEPITFNKIFGAAVCLVGLYFINK